MNVKFDLILIANIKTKKNLSNTIITKIKIPCFGLSHGQFELLMIVICNFLSSFSLLCCYIIYT
jgi:hypothetical protein